MWGEISAVPRPPRDPWSRTPLARLARRRNATAALSFVGRGPPHARDAQSDVAGRLPPSAASRPHCGVLLLKLPKGHQSGPPSPPNTTPTSPHSATGAVAVGGPAAAGGAEAGASGEGRGGRGAT